MNGGSFIVKPALASGPRLFVFDAYAIQDQANQLRIVAFQLGQFGIGVLPYHQTFQQTDQSGCHGAAIGILAELAGFFALLDQVFKVGAVSSVVFREGITNIFPERGRRPQCEELKPKAKRPAMVDSGAETRLAGSIKELPGGQVPCLSQHGLLAFNYSR